MTLGALWLPSLRCDHPELLLLALPVLYALARFRTPSRTVRTLRTIAALLLVLVLAGPRFDRMGEGNDVIVVVDRSRSMPADGTQIALESIHLLESSRGPNDRLGVVAFGSRAAVVQSPRADGGLAELRVDVGADGSDLGGAIDAALSLIPEGRTASLLVLSDGEAKGRDPVGAARRAAARGIPIHVRAIARSEAADVSVERVELPQEVAEGEPFQFSGWVHADAAEDVRYVLRRDGVAISEGSRKLEPGSNRLVFRDRVAEDGVSRYELELFAGENRDRVPENSKAQAAVRVAGRPRILVLNDDGSRDALVSALAGGGIEVEAKRPEDAALDALGLARYRAVILENVAAGRLGSGIRELASFVSDRGGGLLLTGGRASFGVGGYHKSTLDPVLPVSMELRQEMRKMALAVAIALDRSGSMAVSAGGGKTKMDLANEGAAAAIELLSPQDEIAVLAIDSSPHVVVPLMAATDLGEIIHDVMRIRSEGGGIFTRTALEAAARQLKDAKASNRHIILFADANDAEEHEGCDELVKGLYEAGVSLSVIAMGKSTDSDGKFLEDIAKTGGGQVYFAENVADLPRLFAHDLMLVARSSYIEGDIATAVLPDLLGLGAGAAKDFPVLEGYNLTYLRAGCLAGVATTDEWKAPVVAFRYHGLGRSAAFTTPIGDLLARSEGTTALVVTLGRWLIGRDAPEAYFGNVRRDGGEAFLSVEIDRGLDPTATLPGEALVRDASGITRHVVLERVAEDRVEGRVALPAEGVMLGAVDLGDHRVMTLPPVALPYSPEFERSPDPRRGARLLERIAAESGGGGVATLDALFDREGSGLEPRPIGRLLAFIALLVFLLEVLERRIPWITRLAHRSRRAIAGQVARWRLGSNARSPASVERATEGSSVPFSPSGSRPNSPGESRPDSRPDSRDDSRPHSPDAQRHPSSGAPRAAGIPATTVEAAPEAPPAPEDAAAVARRLKRKKRP